MRFALHCSSVCWIAAVITLGLTGCSNASPVSLGNADNGRTVTVGSGAQIDITLGTVGPGNYASPAISSPAVRFVSMAYVCGCTPAGPTQLFRFEGVAPGTATISIPHTGGSDLPFGLVVIVGGGGVVP